MSDLFFRVFVIKLFFGLLRFRRETKTQILDFIDSKKMRNKTKVGNLLMNLKEIMLFGDFFFAFYFVSLFTMFTAIKNAMRIVINQKN